MIQGKQKRMRGERKCEEGLEDHCAAGHSYTQLISFIKSVFCIASTSVAVFIIVPRKQIKMLNLSTLQAVV